MERCRLRELLHIQPLQQHWETIFDEERWSSRMYKKDNTIETLQQRLTALKAAIKLNSLEYAPWIETNAIMVFVHPNVRHFAYLNNHSTTNAIPGRDSVLRVSSIQLRTQFWGVPSNEAGWQWTLHSRYCRLLEPIHETRQAAWYLR